jgi:hypothetical protein
MKKIITLVAIIFIFTSCDKEVIEWSDKTTCAEINAFYEAETKGLSIKDASYFIEDWLDALEEANCPGT